MVASSPGISNVSRLASILYMLRTPSSPRDHEGTLKLKKLVLFRRAHTLYIPCAQRPGTGTAQRPKSLSRKQVPHTTAKSARLGN